MISIETIIIKTDANYNRTAYIKLIDDNVMFDVSDGEYGPIIFDLKLLKEKVKEHEKICNG